MAENSQESTNPTLPTEVANSMADLMSKASPLEAANNSKTFVAEPFFKEEETTTEEPKEATTETPLAEKKPETTATTEEKPTEKTEEAAQTQVAEPVVEQIPEHEFVNLVNQAIADPDVTFGSIQELKAIVEENKKFKAIEAQYKELTQEERARIEVGREFGDFGLYDRVTGIDTAKLSPKEALRQVYFIENIGKNPQFLEKAFEKQYVKTYEEDPDEEFSRMLLENNGQEAIKTIVELQQDLKKRGQISGGADPEDAKKAKEDQDNAWFAAVDTVLSKNDRVTYDLGEGVKINIVTDVKDKQIIQNAMDRPVEFLRSLITDKDGNYDHEALFEFIHRNVYYEKALEEARKAGAATKEESFLKEKKNQVIESGKAGDVGTESKLSDQMAGNFRQLINNC
jgi:hypothetical protein